MKKFEFKPYNSHFPDFYQEEKERLTQYLTGNYQIEHIGSSAVVGLGGKGIIDIMVTTTKEEMENVSQQAQRAGYLLRPLAGTKTRIFLRTEYPEDFENKKVYHLHITFFGSPDWKEAIAFRDYLRIHPEDLKRYANIKKRAAEEANEDPEEYTKIKETTVKEIIAKALLM